MKTSTTLINTIRSNQNPTRCASVSLMRQVAVIVLLALCFGAMPPARAVVVGPYTPDANTYFLFHLDEAAGITVATNATGTIGFSTNAIAFRNNIANTNAAATDNSILGSLGATGFTFGSFSNCAVITNLTGINGSGTVSNGLGVDLNKSGTYSYESNSANLHDSFASHAPLLGANNSFTLEALVNLAALTNAGTREIVCTDNNDANTARGIQFRVNGANLEFGFIGFSTTAFAVAIPTTGSHAFVSGAWFHVAIAHSEVGGNATNILFWTRLADSFTSANAIGTNTTIKVVAAAMPLVLGNEGRLTGGSAEGLRGYLDEVRISKVARTSNQMMFSDGAITIAAQPQSIVVQSGVTTNFSVTASSPISSWSPLGYQWRSNGVPLVNGGDFSGVSSSNLVIANVQSAYATTYDVVITNVLSTNTSSTATLTIRTPLNLAWRGAVNANWDTTANTNWFDTGGLTNSPFTTGDKVTFDNSGNNASPVNLTNAVTPGGVTVNASVAYTISGTGKISGGTGLTKTNSGTLTLASTNDYAGVTTIGGGTVSVGFVANGGSASPVGAASSASANQVLNGGTLSYTGGTASTDRGATLGANGGTVDVSTAATTLILSGAIAGTSGGQLIKTGTGTFALSGANTYDGPTTISAGTLQLTGSGTFGTGNVTNNSVLLSSGTRTLTNVLAGTGSLTNDATGTLTLDGVNSYSGITTINGPSAGGLVVASSGALGNTPQVVVFSTTGGAFGGTRVTLNAGVSTPAGTALSLPTASTTIRSALAAVGAGSWNGPITLNGDGTASPGDQIAFLGSPGLLTIGGNVTGVNFPGTLQLRGGAGAISGTLNLGAGATLQVNDGVTWTINSSGNTWGLSQIANGTMAIGQHNALPTTTTVNFGAAGNGTLDLGGFNQQVAGLVIAGGVNVITNSSATTDSTLTFSTNGGASTYSGTIVNGAKKIALTVAGGTLTLTASNNYSGDTTVSAGTLTLSGAGSIGSSPAINVAGGAAFNVSGVTGGYSLGAAQTLKGNGTVTGAATINGTITPGASIGILTFGTTPTLNGLIVAELDRSAATNADKLIGAGALGGTLTVTNIGPALVNGDTFDLFDGSLSGSFGTLNLPGGATHWNTSDLNVGGTLAFTNANPAASNFSLGVAVGGSATASVIGKYAAAMDADGDSVTITAVSTPANGTASIVGGTNLSYTSTVSAASDSFTYTVSDGLGGTDTKTVSVTISSPEGFNKLSGPTPVGGGQYQLDYLGIPGAQYAIDETSSLTPPITWSPLITNTAAANGALSFTITPANPSGFFRTRSVP